ncbi:hypothetical protein AYX14_03825 [Cryptococcus neoformans]|nr:hypothetical protein AYX14_03825 [Cryptococcus neoformans var. grubii]
MLARRPLLAVRTLSAPLRRLTPLPRPARTLSTATAPLSQSISTTTQYAQPGAAEPEFDLAGRREKWYHIIRTRQGELPVYAKYRNDGGCKTIVRKIEGDSHTLKDQLNEWFEQSHLDPFTRPPQATVRPTNGEVQIKGHWVEEIKEFLSERGF